MADAAWRPWQTTRSCEQARAVRHPAEICSHSSSETVSPTSCYTSLAHPPGPSHSPGIPRSGGNRQAGLRVFFG